MTIKKNTLIQINSSRHPIFKAIAIKDFDTNDEWYPVSLADDYLEGMSKCWVKGDEVPCRKSLVRTFKIIKELINYRLKQIYSNRKTYRQCRIKVHRKRNRLHLFQHSLQ